jgi:NAD(P)-dependent dehydrogenase (short-subunit alcohol dehydrogenase family)
MSHLPDDNRTVLITGAVGGIGCALVNRFAQAGCRVIAVDVNPRIETAFAADEKVRRVVADVSQEQSVQRLFRQLDQDSVVLDLIINNAGVDGYFPLSQTDVAAFEAMMAINVFGAMRINQMLLSLLQTPGGRIFHISSESVGMTMPFMPYPLTKTLLDAYSRALRIELSLVGIDVVSIRPGAVATPLTDAVGRIPRREDGAPMAEWFNRFADIAPRQIGRRSAPDELAAFVYRLSRRRSLRAVYRFNNMLKLRLAAWMPAGLVAFAVRRMLSGR